MFYRHVFNYIPYKNLGKSRPYNVWCHCFDMFSATFCELDTHTPQEPRVKLMIWEKLALKGLNRVDLVKCFMRSSRVNSCLSGSCFQHLVFFTRSYQPYCNTKKQTETENCLLITQNPTVTIKTRYPLQYWLISSRRCNARLNIFVDFVKLGRSLTKPFTIGTQASNVKRSCHI